MSNIVIVAIAVGGYTAIFWLADSIPCLLLQRHDRHAGWRGLIESCVLAGFVMTGRLVFDWPWTEVSAKPLFIVCFLKLAITLAGRLPQMRMADREMTTLPWSWPALILLRVIAAMGAAAVLIWLDPVILFIYLPLLSVMAIDTIIWLCGRWAQRGMMLVLPLESLLVCAMVAFLTPHAAGYKAMAISAFLAKGIVAALSRMIQMRDIAILPDRPADKVFLMLRATGSALGIWLMVFNLR